MVVGTWLLLVDIGAFCVATLGRELGQNKTPTIAGAQVCMATLYRSADKMIKASSQINNVINRVSALILVDLCPDFSSTCRKGAFFAVITFAFALCAFAFCAPSNGRECWNSYRWWCRGVGEYRRYDFEIA